MLVSFFKFTYIFIIQLYRSITGLINVSRYKNSIYIFFLNIWPQVHKKTRVSYTVSHFSYAPFFQGPHFLTKMLESNILYDNLFIDILSV